MAGEIALTKATERAAQAEALMRNEMLQESFEGLVAAYTKAWRGSTDMDERDRCWHRVQAIDEVRMRLTNVMSGGRIAQAELDQIAQKRENQNG